MTDSKYMRPDLDFALGKAIEEAGEFLAAAGKALRFGWDSYNPEFPPEDRATNELWVRQQLGDLSGALLNLVEELDARKRGKTTLAEEAAVIQGSLEMTLPAIELVSARVHEAWMRSKLAAGVASRKLESGEELMVPYEQLSEQAKELDRGTVKAVYAAIKDARNSASV